MAKYRVTYITKMTEVWEVEAPDADTAEEIFWSNGKLVSSDEDPDGHESEIKAELLQAEAK